MNAHRAINVALALGGFAVAIVIWNDYLIERDASVHASGFASGFNAASASMSEKAVIDRMCMAFWFGGDTKRVSKAIQKVKATNE